MASVDSKTFFNKNPFGVSLTKIEEYQQRVNDITTNDPRTGDYDCTLVIEADFNTIYSDLTYMTYSDDADQTQRHKNTGSLDTWLKLHELLNTGSFNDGEVITASAKTAIRGNENIIDSDKTWFTFWAGLISQVIDSTDIRGGSVQRDILKQTLNNSNPPTELESENDILGSLINATTVDFDQDIATVPTFLNHFWAAIIICLIDTFGSTYEGQIATDTANLMLREGDAIGLWFRTRSNDNTNSNPKNGLIKLQQLKQQIV